MSDVRVLVVDDEPLARAGLRGLVARVPGCIVAGECADGASAARRLVELRPDVALLDIQMPEMNGFAVLRAAAAAGLDPLPIVVFITAFDEFAIEAFRVHALDYLVKPFTDDQFAGALGRARDAVRTAGELEASRRMLRLLDAQVRLVVRVDDRAVVIEPRELRWIEADSYYAKLHLAGVAHLLRESLTSLEGRLDPDRFVRTHRSAIVNIDFVREVGRTELGLVDGTRVPLARDRRNPLLAHLARRGRRP